VMRRDARELDLISDAQQAGTILQALPIPTDLDMQPHNQKRSRRFVFRSA
jgi:hypothetical protein